MTWMLIVSPSHENLSYYYLLIFYCIVFKMEDKIMSNTLRKIPVISKTNISKFCTSLSYFVIGILYLQLDLAIADANAPPAAAAGPTRKPSTTITSSSSTTAAKSVVTANTTDTPSNNDNHEPYEGYGNVLYDKSMLRRSFYVLIGFTCLAVVFFAVRWFRSRGKRKSKKYGVLATRSSDMELRPLDQEDDEEDMTVFDVNSK